MAFDTLKSILNELSEALTAREAPVPSGIRKFVSDEITVSHSDYSGSYYVGGGQHANDLTLTVAHTLGVVPQHVSYVLVATAANNGYAVGDEVLPLEAIDDGRCVHTVTASSITLRFRGRGLRHANNLPFSLVDKTDRGGFRASREQWNLKVVLWG